MLLSEIQPWLQQHTWDWNGASMGTTTIMRVHLHRCIHWILIRMQVIRFRFRQLSVIQRIPIDGCSWSRCSTGQYCIIVACFQMFTRQAHWSCLTANGMWKPIILMNNFWIAICSICKCCQSWFLDQCSYVIVWLWSIKTKLCRTSWS